MTRNVGIKLMMMAGMAMVAGAALSGCTTSELDDSADQSSDQATADEPSDQAATDTAGADRAETPEVFFTFSTEKPADLPDDEDATVSAAAITTHSHAYRVVSDFQSNRWASPSYITHSRARTCWHTTKSTDQGDFEYQFVWYDGGANKRIYKTSGQNNGWYCSNWLSLPNRQNKVYDIVIENGSFGVTVGGTLYIYTN